MAAKKKPWIIITLTILAIAILMKSNINFQAAIVPTTDSKCVKSDVAIPGSIASWRSAKWISVDRNNDGAIEGFGMNSIGASTQNTCAQIYTSYGLITTIAGVAETGFKGDVYVYKYVDTPDQHVIVCRDSTSNLASNAQFRVNSPYFVQADTSACGSACTNQCSALGARQCSGASGYITCQTGTNGCLVFGTTVTQCPANTACISGNCVTSGTDADTNGDGKIDWTEINTYVNKWISGTVTWADVNTAVNKWITGAATSTTTCYACSGSSVVSTTTTSTCPSGYSTTYPTCTSTITCYACSGTSVVSTTATSTCPSGYSTTYPTCGTPSGNKYLILTTSSLQSSAQSLATHRSSQYTTKIVLVDGQSKEQIMQTIRTENPKYVLIAGADSAIPSDSSSDNYYADLSGDRAPEIAVGRIPAKNSAELSNLVQKIIRFESEAQYAGKNVAFFGGSEDVDIACSSKCGTGGWQTMCLFECTVLNHLYLPSQGWSVTKIACGCQNLLNPPYPQCTGQLQKILDAWNQGQMTVAYNGHGGNTLMSGCEAKDYLSRWNLLPAITSTKTPVFVGFSCATAALNDPNDLFLSTGMLFEANKGAVAYIGSTYDTGSFPNTLFDRLNSESTLGDAFRTAKAESDSTVQYQFQLLGDPALKLR